MVAQLTRSRLCTGACFGGSMQREFDVVIERDSEGYYVASVAVFPA